MSDTLLLGSGGGSSMEITRGTRTTITITFADRKVVGRDAGWP